jgi:Tfp pilus assembly protein PilX
MKNERGMALIAAMMVMLLMSALMIGFTTIVMSDQRYRGIDKDRTRAFYGAQSGLEKLTVDLGNLFLTNVAPTNAQIAALSNNPPVIPNVTFVAPQGVTAYGITPVPCNPQGQFSCNAQIQTGSYQGLMAIKQKYNVDVVAKTPAGGEAHLTRVVESVAIPVFQFGIFSDVDLAFFAGPNFNFGGRVHTNGNLFLSEGNGSSLTLTDKVTAVKEIVRQRLQNGVSIDTPSAHAGTVNMATGTNSFRPLLRTEASVQDGLSPATTNTSWPTISLSTYNGYIRNGSTGAKALNLPVITIGGANTALVRRPPVNENTTDPILYGERLYSKVSLRIMLSDFANDITSLPTVTATAPVQLDGNWNVAAPAGYAPISGTNPPIARSPGVQTITTTANTLVGDAFIQIAAPPAGIFFHQPIWPMQVWSGNPLVPLVQINCTAVTPTQFQNCTNAGGGNIPAVPAGATVFSPVVDTFSTTMTTTIVQGAGTPRTYTVASTAGWAANTFWMRDKNTLAWTVVTCTGWTNQPNLRLTNCTNVPATNAGAGVITTGALQARDSGTIGGFIKIDMQDTAGVWRDVTMEILNYGIGAANQAGANCGDPSPNAILRIQRLRDNGGTCHYANSTDASDYWPQTLFDPREALFRDVAPVDINNNVIRDVLLGGVMHYVALDVRNLSRWFQGTGAYAGGTGINAFNTGGYSVYFSDRRNNRDANALETGEYGFEDFVNPASGAGTPNNTLDPGEDVNANAVLDTYGQFPSYNGVVNAMPPGAVAPFSAAARPWTQINVPGAIGNRAILFRRAIKLINGGLGNIVAPGFTVVTENPVYVQGDWNAGQAGFANNDGHVATSVIADAVTLLSNEWTDANGYANPYNPGNRNRGTPAFYRLAIIGGKGLAFAQPANTATDFGTDGGAHNFLRYLENGNQAVNYRGSLATFFFNRQAVGTFKCCTTVYGAPQRNYAFDTDFLNPAQLPPLTPVFRDLNALGFSQELRPGR